MEVASGVSQDKLASPHRLPSAPFSAGNTGILRTTILPSFALHSGLSLLAYGAARATDRLELKDWLWPSGMVINAWWNILGRSMYHEKLSLGCALSALSWTEKLLLGGVTAWGTRLFYRIVSRSLRQDGDDPRYVPVKKEPGFWNKALFQQFIPEAVFQTIITLPFTLPFRTPMSLSRPPYADIVQGAAVGLFVAGMTLEVLADAQIESHKRKSSDLNCSGVWSIVRHPNYLGDALVHISFPLLLYGSSLFQPLTLLGPLANYVFLRFVSGDKENEANQEERYKSHNQEKYHQLQEWRAQKNSFWPGVNEITNPWTWAVIGAGVLGVVVERAAKGYFSY